MSVRAAFVATTLAAWIGAGYLGLVLHAAETAHAPYDVGAAADGIIDATSGRADPTFLATVIVVLTAVGGTSFAGTVLFVLNKMVGRHLSESREDHRAALSAFRSEMETERGFHATQVAALMASDDRQHAEMSATLQRVVQDFRSELRGGQS